MLLDPVTAVILSMQCMPASAQCLQEAALHVKIEQHESGGRNVFNYLHATDPGYYTASGYYQITNSTWREGAGLAGVNLSEYPTAISAPYAVQRHVADALLRKYGIRPWAMDAPLMNDLQRSGVQPSASQTTIEEVPAPPCEAPPTDVWGQLACHETNQTPEGGQP